MECINLHLNIAIQCLNVTLKRVFLKKKTQSTFEHQSQTEVLGGGAYT